MLEGTLSNHLSRIGNDEKTENLKLSFESKKRFTWATKNPKHLTIHEMILINQSFSDLSIESLVKDYGAGKEKYTELELNFITSKN